MKPIRFIQSVTIYPDEKTGEFVKEGEVRSDLSAEYAALMVVKGHAVEEEADAEPAPAEVAADPVKETGRRK